MLEEVAYVGQEAQNLALEWERRLRKVNQQAGLLFVSVSPVPSRDGRSKVFNIWVGISKKLDPGTAIAVIKHIFKEEIEEGKYTINASAVRGVHGAARDSSDEDPRPLTS